MMWVFIPTKNRLRTKGGLMELSSVVQQYQQVTRDSTNAINQRAEKNAAQIALLLSPYLAAGEKMPDLKLVFLLLSRRVQQQQQHIEDADQKHAQELGDDAAALEARDTAVTNVYSELTQIRNEVEAAFGEAGTRALGMSGETPRGPALLERYASDILDRLNKEINLGTPLRKRSNFDHKAAADDLAPLCEALKRAIANVAKEIAEAKETQDARNNSISEWDKNVPPTILAARSLFTLAGDIEGASRLYTTPASYRRSPSEPTEKTEPKA
jgi:hypothetical protein